MPKSGLIPFVSDTFRVITVSASDIAHEYTVRNRIKVYEERNGEIFVAAGLGWLSFLFSEISDAKCSMDSGKIPTDVFEKMASSWRLIKSYAISIYGDDEVRRYGMSMHDEKLYRSSEACMAVSERFADTIPSIKFRSLDSFKKHLITESEYRVASASVYAPYHIIQTEREKSNG